MQHLYFSPEALSNTTSENQTEFYDTYIQRQGLEEGMYLVNILKVEINRQKKTNTSWLVTTTKEIMKSPIQKLNKPTF